MKKIIPLTSKERVVLSGIFRKEGFHSGVTEYSNFDGRVPFNKIESPTFHAYLVAYKTVFSQMDCIVGLLEHEDLTTFRKVNSQYQSYKILTDSELHGSIKSELFHRYRETYLRIHDEFVSYLNGQLGRDITAAH